MHNLVLAVGFGLVSASVLALSAVGVTLQFGVTNYVNFAYGSYIAVSGYVAWMFNAVLGLNFWLSVFASALLIGVLAVIVNRVLLQPFTRKGLPTLYMLIVTLGLWLILSNLVLVIWGPDPRQFNLGDQTPIGLGPFQFTPPQLLIIGVSAATLFLVHLLLTRTKLGKAMRAMSNDATLAQASGINTNLIVDVTWLLTGFLIGVSGCVLALNLSSFSPSFGDDYMFVIFSAVILGGVGQPYGTMIGAVIIGLATELSAMAINSAYKSDIAFALLIVALLIRPQGLIPARSRT